MSMIKIISPKGKTIYTDSSPEIERILEIEGILWFETLKKSVSVSEKAFNEVNDLISRHMS